jgi:hypothetical protein
MSMRVCYLHCHEAELCCYSKCHVTSNKDKSNLECAEEKFQTRGWVRGCEKWKAASCLQGTLEAGYTYGFSIGRTSVKKLLPSQAMCGILLGMRGRVRSYVTFAIRRGDGLRFHELRTKFRKHWFRHSKVDGGGGGGSQTHKQHGDFTSLIFLK